MQLDHALRASPWLALVLGVAHGWGANAPHSWWLQLATLALVSASILLAARRGFVAVSILNALGFCAASAAVAHAWLFTALAPDTVLGWPLATLVFVALIMLLCLLPAVAFGISAVVVTFLKPHRAMLAPITFAIAFPLAEIATNSLIGFAWSSTGYSAVGSPLAPLYSWLGVHGMAALVCLLAALVGETLAEFALRRVANKGLNAPDSALAFVCVLAVAAGTAWLASRVESTQSTATPLRTRIVQPAVDPAGKFDGARLRSIARDLAALAIEPQQETQRGARLVVAPETAIPHRWAGLPDDVVDTLLQAVSSREDTFLLGMVDADPVVGLLNVSNALRSGSRLSPPQRHVKTRLVPVAEDATPGLRWLSDALALRYPERATLDEPPVVFHVGGVGVRTTICLDLAFGGDLSSTAAATGILVNQSNLSAFPGERVRAQFTTIARVRALEQGKPLLLVANDGPSAAIGADGRVLASLPPAKPGALSVEIYPRTGVTPYAMVGEAIWLAPLVLLGFALVVRSAAPTSRQRILPRPPDS
jgi:apolipoprotein N-acyltransferase